MRSFDYITVIYFTAISLMAVFLTIHDKRRAIASKSRISERTLMLIALIGGALPMYIAMRCIRHKTLHNKFMLGLPVIFLIQVFIILLLK